METLMEGGELMRGKRGKRINEETITEDRGAGIRTECP